MVRRTGLQIQVLRFYKQTLQMIASKPHETRPAWYAFAAHHFRDSSLGGGLKPRDHTAIEYMMRRGMKQLETYGRNEVKTVQAPMGSERWPLGWVGKGGKEGLGRQ